MTSHGITFITFINCAERPFCVEQEADVLAESKQRELLTG